MSPKLSSALCIFPLSDTLWLPLHGLLQVLVVSKGSLSLPWPQIAIIYNEMETITVKLVALSHGKDHKDL